LLSSASYFLSCRLNEICQSIHQVKHPSSYISEQFISSSSSSSITSLQPSILNTKEYVIKHLPLQQKYIQDYIRNEIMSEQLKMTDVLKARINIIDMINIDIIDNFKQMVSNNIIDVCNNMADSILTRCLIDTIMDLEDDNYNVKSIIS